MKENKGQFSKGNTPWNKGKTGWTTSGSFKKGHGRYRTDESYKLGGIKIAKNPNSKKTQFKKGFIPWNKGRVGLQVAWNKGKKTGHIPWNKGKHFIAMRGSKHWNWQGGKIEAREKIRKSVEYKNWRRAVFQRDNWTCVLCLARGKYLNADHIKPFAYFPELRFMLDNGRTLCVPCHKKTDTYMNRWSGSRATFS